MQNLKRILFVLSYDEKMFLVKILFFLILSLFLEMLSFAIIIPVFDIIFLNNGTNYFFSNYINFFNSNEKFFKIIVLLFVIIIFFFKNIYLITVNFFTVRFFNKFNNRISNDLFNMYLKQNYSYFSYNKSEYLLRRLTTDCAGTKFYLNCILNLIIEFFFIFGLSMVLLWFHYKIFIFCFSIFLVVSTFYILVIKTRIKSWSYEHQDNVGLLQKLIIEGVAGIKDIIIFNLKKLFLKQFASYSAKSHMSYFKIDFVNNIQRLWMEVVAIVVIIFPLILFLLFEKPVDNLIPIFALFSIALFRIIPSVNRLLINFQQVKFYKPSFETTYEQFSEFHNDYIQQKNNYNLFFKSYIEFKNLSYRHNKGSKDILHDVNIKILKNSSVAILGENGSGKSTFLDLISGLIKPTAGTVSIDSKYNIFDNKISWLNKLSYVQQDIFLLNSSIKNNITLQEDADVILDKKFDEISRVLQLDNVFKDFPEKLYTKISKTSINLSGGQKQLISIARALYKDSEVILLDEPNSALDSNNLALFKDLILSLKGKKTIVMIIHDINKFDKCFDSVYQIDGGSINIV